MPIDETSLQNMGSDMEAALAEETPAESGEEFDSSKDTEEPDVAEKIKFKDREYTPEELDELVGLGSRAKELGDSHGGFDKFVTEYGRKSEKIGELNRQLEQLSKVQTTGAPVEEVEDQMEAARDAARKLGIVLKDDLDTYYQSRRGAERLLESCGELEAEIDGSDGRPKFETTAVLEFMEKNAGFTDPKRAYEAMNLDTISSWKAEKLSKTKAGGITTITTGGGEKLPPQVKPTGDNLRDLISEQFS